MRAARSASWLLLCGCLAAVEAGMAQEVRPVFEVATVKAAPHADPNTGGWSPPGTGRFEASHVSLALLLQLAYGIDASQIAGKPGWLETNLYDVVAKPEDGVKLSREELKPRLQEMLQTRFHLVAYMETRPGRGYALVVAQGGPHLSATKGDHFPGSRINVSPGEMGGANWSMPIFAKYLTSAAGFPVVDETSLTGSYDISFRYEVQPTEQSMGLPLADALREATGLLLKPQKVPVPTLVITSVDAIPTDN